MTTRLRFALFVLCALALAGRDVCAKEIVGTVSVTASVQGGCIFKSSPSETALVTLDCVKGSSAHVASAALDVSTARTLLVAADVDPRALGTMPSPWKLVTIDL